MDEIRFVLKCLLVATVILFLSQIKVHEETLEAKAEFFLQRSPLAHTLYEVAEGGAEFARKSFDSTKEYIQEKMAQTGGSHEPHKNK